MYPENSACKCCDTTIAALHVDDFWQVLGPDLEDMSIEGIDVCMFTLVKIRTFCAKLQAISIIMKTSRATEAEAYIDLLASRGTHLLGASLTFVRPLKSL